MLYDDKIISKIRHGVAAKFLLFVVLVSTVVILSTTAARIYSDYKKAINTINLQLLEIQESYIEVITSYAWVANTEMLQKQIDGISRLPNIRFLELRIHESPIITAGKRKPFYDITREYPLVWKYREEEIVLGSLRVNLSFDALMKSLKYEAVEIISVQIITIIVISGLIFYLFYLMVGKHLNRMARYTKSLSLNRLDIPLVLDRSKISGNSQDELSLLCKSINQMRENLITDIKKREVAEEALRESEEKYRHLFESSMDAILLFDPGNGYLDCNPAAFELFGIKSKKQLSGLTPADLSPKYQPGGTLSSEKANKMISMAFETGSNLFEWKHANLDGEEFYASVLATRIKINGQTIIQQTIRDISDYKRTQEMMVQSEKMLSVGGLAAGMAHEINNPLAGMMQTADVMAKRLTNVKMPANMRTAKEIGIDMDDINAFMEKRDIPRMLTTINESGRRIAAIVGNMLGFARKSDTRASSHDLAELLDKTLELAVSDFDLKKHYDFKMIEIKKEYDGNAPPVPCEPAKIQQVLLNILRNGAQAMQEAGTEKPVFIVRTRFDKKQKAVCVEIGDNGPGMDEEIRKRVFEPFYTTKPVGVGTGLGLSVSYFIITENHDGEMSVESTPGSGAMFIICLPLERKEA
ncbi:MAG: PAS domain S-box protein [Desulfobacteraceae bacterium]|nr:PAS domain S-box protein [Desulfobacteraceae bacterium]